MPTDFDTSAARAFERRARRARAKARALRIDSARRAKSARVFLSLAFGDDLQAFAS